VGITVSKEDIDIIRLNHLAMVLMSLTVTATASALEETALKTYQVTRMKENSTIDADWNKRAWKNVETLPLEYFMGQKPDHLPKVQAKVSYDDDFIYVIWRVEDNYVLARRTNNQELVCKDSCVEFFFTPSGDPDKNGYFNLETSCSGVMMFAANVPGVPNGVTAADITRVVIAGSLKGPIDTEIAKPTTWTLEYKIPIDVLQRLSQVQKPGPGVTWRANFYKCADESSHPHWLTWSHVDWPTPRFHIPKYFGTLSFQ